MARNYTGAIIRLCNCGDCQGGMKNSPCLLCYEEDGEEYAHCTICGKTWHVKTLELVESPA